MMTISQGMTYTLAAALVALSARAAFAPRGAALAYGVPLPEGAAPTPFLEVKANRDFVLAGLLPPPTHGRSRATGSFPVPPFTSEPWHI